MNLYNKYFKNNYEELITYYPKYYREVLEMEAILKAHGRIADSLEDSAERVYKDCFIDTADEETITRLEHFWKIGRKESHSLEERRRLIKAYITGFGKISASLLNEIIFAYIGAYADIVFTTGDSVGNNLLYINIESDCDVAAFHVSDIQVLFSRKIPAHIAWLLVIHYFVLFLERIFIEVPTLTVKGKIFRKRLIAPEEVPLERDVAAGFLTRCSGRLNPGAAAGLFVEKDLWRLDGSVLLNGSRKLDAEVYRIDIS